VLWNRFAFWYPKLDITETDFLEIVDHVPVLNIKTPGNSAMVSMHSSIFRYLNVKTLAVISKQASWKHAELLQLCSSLLFSQPFVLCRYISDNWRKTALFYGNLRNEITFLEYVWGFFYLKLNRSFGLCKYNKVLKCWNFLTLGSLLGAFSIVFEEELFMGYQTEDWEKGI